VYRREDLLPWSSGFFHESGDFRALVETVADGEKMNDPVQTSVVGSCGAKKTHF
jgi:hypothetical protein